MEGISGGMCEEDSKDLAMTDRLFLSPDEHCDSDICTKACFAQSCFDWCLCHDHPSVEDIHGTVPVTRKSNTKDAAGNVVTRTDVKHQRVCGHPQARDSPGVCRIVTSPFAGMGDYWQFEQEREMQDMMARGSP